MKNNQLSHNKTDAIAFAKLEYSKDTRFWPRLLIRCLEAKQLGEAQQLTTNIYMETCHKRMENVVEPLLQELQALMTEDDAEPSVLRSRAHDIWYDASHTSLMSRGVTRLFGALANFQESNFDDYEVELTRAIAMLTASGNATMNDCTFRGVIRKFQKDAWD